MPGHGGLGVSSLIAFLVNCAGVGVALGSYVLLARLMPLSELGTYALVMAWIGLAATALSGGTQLAVVRLVATYRRGGDEARAVAAWETAQRASLALLAAGGTVALAACLLLRPDALQTVLAAALLTAAIALARLYAAAGRAFGSPIVPLAADVLVRDGLIALLALVLLLLGWRGLDAGTALNLTLSASALAALAGGRAVAMAVPRSSEPVRPTGSELLAWVRTAAPLLGIALLQMWLARVDTVVLGFLAGPEEVGIFAVAWRIAALVAFPLTAINIATGPAIAGAASGGDRPALQDLLARSAVWSTLAGLAVALPLLLFPHWLLGLAGPELTRGATVLRILVAGQLICAITGMANVALAMSDHSNASMVAYGGAALASLLLNAALIPLLGGLGAAAAATAVVIGLRVAILLLLWRRLGVLSLPFVRRGRLAHA